jgi:hypothetical protein
MITPPGCRQKPSIDALFFSSLPENDPRSPASAKVTRPPLISTGAV